MKRRWNLRTSTKGSLSMLEYVERKFTLANTLVALQNPIPEDDLVNYILYGQDPEYRSFQATINTRKEPINIDELLDMLLQEEEGIEQSKAIPIVFSLIIIRTMKKTLSSTGSEGSLRKEQSNLYKKGNSPPLVKIEKTDWFCTSNLEKKHRVDKIALVGKEIFLVRLKAMVQLHVILNGEHHFFDSKPLIMKAWNPDMEILKEPIKTIPI
ncbi:50S ribosomal protein L31 type B [Bienertia sinuspersici]